MLDSSSTWLHLMSLFRDCDLLHLAFHALAPSRLKRLALVQIVPPLRLGAASCSGGERFRARLGVPLHHHDAVHWALNLARRQPAGRREPKCKRHWTRQIRLSLAAITPGAQALILISHANPQRRVRVAIDMLAAAACVQVHHGDRSQRLGSSRQVETRAGECLAISLWPPSIVAEQLPLGFCRHGVRAEEGCRSS